MAIATMDNYVAGARQRLGFFKLTQTLQSGRNYSLWRFAGNPGAGAIPPSGAGEIATAASSGALHFVNPSGGAETLLEGFTVSGGRAGQIVTLYDRLWHNAGLVANTTSAQVIGSPALTRPDALGAGTRIWLEIYTQLGVGAAVITATYTNQDGTGSRSATTTYPGGATGANIMLEFDLQAGDSGVRSVEQVQLSASTGSVGNFGIVIARDLADAMIGPDGTGDLLNFFQMGAPNIYPDAALALRVLVGSTGTLGDLIGSVRLVQG